jgi:hypothetical protein
MILSVIICGLGYAEEAPVTHPGRPARHLLGAGGGPAGLVGRRRD